jgi:LacI family transcriptional regulator
MNDCPRVALIFKTRLEENITILNAIARYDRYHEKWSAYVDDMAVAQKDADWLFKQSWDGVLCKHSAPDLFRQCLEKGIPCVDLSDDDVITEGIPKIAPDNIAVGHKGAEHFIERGYQHFAFCGFSNESWSVARKKGFDEGLRLTGHKCSVYESSYPKISDPEWDLRETAKIAEWIQTLKRPLCVMACNDLRGLQVLQACRNSGLQVPEDVAVLGTNNETIRCELSHPQLSSIPLNADFYGREAARILSDMIAGIKPESMHVLVDPLEVVTRRSTDILAIENKVIADSLHIIHERACQGLVVDDLVREVHVSRSLLERQFRRYLGKSPQAEIRSVQLQKIKQLLSETDYTLAYVAELTGFEHPEYMSVMFKRITHLTPKQYRQKFSKV